MNGRNLISLLLLTLRPGAEARGVFLCECTTFSHSYNVREEMREECTR